VPGNAVACLDIEVPERFAELVYRPASDLRRKSVNVSDLISSMGYWAVFLLVVAESLGIPLPGETALITAGVYAGHTHRLNPWLIFVVGAAAAIVGDNIGYWVGDKGGYPLARRYGRRVRLDERKLKIARYLFDRHGAKVVFFGRFVSILRTYAAFLAGTSKMRWRKFLPANAEISRWLGIIAASLGAISAAFVMPYYPVWALVYIIIAIMVIYGLSAHYGEQTA